MSARRHLWDRQVSLIHLEIACLQIRKICEVVAHLHILAAELEYSDIPVNVRKRYQVGKILKYLSKLHRFNPIYRARLLAENEIGNETKWQLNIEDTDHEDVDRVISIYNRCGNMLHQLGPYNEHPNNTKEAAISLLRDRNSIRSYHQWLWNFLWQHAIHLSDTPFLFFNMGSNSEVTMPTFIKHEGFLEEDVVVNFDPEYLADFTGQIDWDDFDD
ncbi:MAG: hypothetical protein GY751_01785 [Bacteroidetes bacterium]|nr:hypothetical protein [Bacteroidota bacterium]